MQKRMSGTSVCQCITFYKKGAINSIQNAQFFSKIDANMQRTNFINPSILRFDLKSFCVNHVLK